MGEPRPNRLRVELIKARNLPVMDKALVVGQGSTDPVATLSFDGVSKKSTVKMTTLTPEWNEAFLWDVGNAAGGEDEEVPPLTVVLEDYDRASSNDFIGKVEVSIAPLMGKAPQVRFRALQPKDAKGAAALEAARKKKANRRPGLLSQLFGKRKPKDDDDASGSPRDGDGDGDDEALNAAHAPLGEVELLIELSYDPERDFFARPEPPPPGKLPNELQIAVLRGRELAPMDAKLLGGPGTSDPVVTFTCGLQSVKSTVSRRTLNPRFYEEFSICLPPPPLTVTTCAAHADWIDAQAPPAAAAAGAAEGDGAGAAGATGAEAARVGSALEVLVEDWDLMSANDFMGRCGLALAPLVRSAGARDGPRWHELSAKEGTKAGSKEAKRARGALELAVRGARATAREAAFEGWGGARGARARARMMPRGPEPMISGARAVQRGVRALRGRGVRPRRRARPEGRRGRERGRGQGGRARGRAEEGGRGRRRRAQQPAAGAEHERRGPALYEAEAEALSLPPFPALSLSQFQAQEPAAVEPPGGPGGGDEDEAARAEREQAEAAAAAAYVHPLSKSKTPNELLVALVQASGLVAADFSLTGASTSDPLVTLQVGGVTRKSEVRGTGDARSSRRARVASRALARAGSRATARDRVLR